MRTFDPWIGARYAIEGIRGRRLLILGEAHYGTGDTYSTYTSVVIREMALQKSRLPIFSRIQNLVLGSRGGFSPAEREDFWQRVAFYNFIQSYPGPTARRRPTPAMWLDAREALLHTLHELAPQMMLVLGLQLSRNLPEIPKEISVCVIQHPSSPGFAYAKWQPIVQSALAAAPSHD